MTDMPMPVRATESGAHGSARAGLSEAALVILAQEVVLRLSTWARETAAARRPRVVPDVDALCKALIGLDPGAARHMLLEAHRRGATHQDLCLVYIGEAARRLGEMCEQDRLPHPGMAVAAGRMLCLLRDLRDLAPPGEPRGGRVALFATVPGESHVLGVTMAADLCRKAGWDVDLRLGLTDAALGEVARSGGYPVIGLSAANADRVRALARSVAGLRLAAPRSLILVAGSLVRLEPDIAARVGADGAAFEMDRCRDEMERLFALAPGTVRAR